jgi:CPA1 family monovalent cation:H+ antiporter
VNVDAGLFFVGLLGLAVVVAIAARKLAVPYTVALVVVGLVLGLLHPATEPRLTRETLVLVFLPGLVYEATLHLDVETFWANKKTILLLELPSVAAVMVLAAAALALLAPFVGMNGVRFVDGLLFGALIAATDPIAVVALFRTLGAPKRLMTIVEGESLINDGIVVVLFTVLLEVATGGRPFTVVGASLDLVRILSVGALAGANVAVVVACVARAVSDAVSRVALTMVVAYGSFLLAERFHASGLVATLVAGVMTTRAQVGGAPGTAERRVVESCWEFAAFALDSLVFLLVGFQAVQLVDLGRLWKLIVAAYLVVTAGRAVVVALVGRAVRRSRERLPQRWGPVLVWSGLRGALAMVLAIDVPESLPARQPLLTATCGVVVLSILLQGSTMAGLLRRLGLVHEAGGEHALPDDPVMETSPSVLLKPVESMARHAGWAMALRGILAVAFGIIMLRSPRAAVSALVIVFAIYAFADALLDFTMAARLGRAGQRWGWYLFEGIVSVALGVIALAYPGVTLLALVLFVALRAIILGVIELAAAFSGEAADHRWLLGLTGALSVILGIVLLASPVAGGLALIWAIGVYAIVFGVALFALGLRLISEERHEKQMHGPPATAS